VSKIWGLKGWSFRTDFLIAVTKVINSEHTITINKQTFLLKVDDHTKNKKAPIEYASHVILMNNKTVQ